VNTVRLLETVKTSVPDGILVTYRFDFAGRAHEVWFRVSGVEAVASTEVFAALALLPAMTASADLVFETRLSEQLRGNINTIQDVFSCWGPGQFKRISLRGPATTGSSNAGGEVGCFFSGGVDSFYSLLNHKDEISTVVLVHGFDVKLSDTILASTVSGAVRAVANQLNKKVVEVATNLRDFSNEHVKWNMYHGSALVAVGLLLSGSLARAYIPASHTYCDLMPWGSHPLIDPLWSTEQFTFVHDGCEATRVEKVAAIAKSEVAMNNLRVCWRNPNGAYNCGECDKCLRTMVNLHLAGALGRCKTFPAKLDFNQIARTPVVNESARAFAKENIRALRARGGEADLIAAIEDAVHGRYQRGIWRMPKKIRRWFRKKVARRLR
jgi:hypothetical protein